jgi:hypothetical protein
MPALGPTGPGQLVRALRDLASARSRVGTDDVSERWPWDEIEGCTIVRIEEVDADDQVDTMIRILLDDGTGLVIKVEDVGGRHLRWHRDYGPQEQP